jgi:Lon protease-like protein
MDEQSWLPLFPLNTVLFPGGVLPLKVFEARYVDMVRACMKDGKPFGVVRIRTGQEVGLAAEPDTVGCIAHIAHWDMQEAGILLLRVEGGERFRILETRTLANQGLQARVRMITPDAAIAASSIHLDCARALKAVIEDLAGRAAREPGFISPFPSAARLDDAAWVANRWCEILPIPLAARQKLLELEDAGSRLAIVHRYLKQHGVI